MTSLWGHVCTEAPCLTLGRGGLHELPLGARCDLTWLHEITLPDALDGVSGNSRSTVAFGSNEHR